ncbi:MAG: penicillin-binding protein [Rhodospirillaceae bacterium]|nr:penicillin-binding protein [Rhodospirillaceae bacterium]
MRWLIYIFSLLLVTSSIGIGGVIFLLYTYGQGLPEYGQLADYRPPVVTRVHGGDGRLIAEYAKERRVFVPINVMPKLLIKAFLSSEDKNFYSHKGVDIISLISAAFDNIANFYSKKRPRGASTITQQVAKNFLLTNELSIERKIKEAILAFRIEKAFSKDRILELYLNEIYLGLGSYGVATAALNYFDKSLDNLTVAEAAYLAALPKAPNNYHPVHNKEAALIRRNWVIQQMYKNGFISQKTMKSEQSSMLSVMRRSETEFVNAEYFVEDVRRELLERYGSKRVYGGGLSVRTSVDPRMQKFADQALRYGLMRYDWRHGWRGPLASIKIDSKWDNQLRQVKKPAGMLTSWKVAAVIESKTDVAKIGFSNGEIAFLDKTNLPWTRLWKPNQGLGRKIKGVDDILSKGDVIIVEGSDNQNNIYKVRQIPNVGGAVVVLDPHTGRVLALTGGWSFETSEFNRATQAYRQPGSAFKPFVYLAALDKGFSPATRILDAPFVIDQGPGLGKWKPANYTKKFYGPSAMRVGIEKSRNLMTVRLARTIGMDLVSNYANKFNIMAGMPKQLSMSLGAGETTLLRLTSAYAMLVNGGKKIVPTLIDRIQDRNGRTIFKQEKRNCMGCNVDFQERSLVPQLPDFREQVAKSTSAYQMVRMLEGVVKRGTGRRIASLKKPLAGKTGTTNKNFDTWFIGFTPDLAVGVYVGFDKPRTLGKRDTGSNVAAPIFKKFMESALENMPEIPFRAPPGIMHVRINPSTGALARTENEKVIMEVFKPGNQPGGVSKVLDGGYAADWKPGQVSMPTIGESGARGSQGIY